MKPTSPVDAARPHAAFAQGWLHRHPLTPGDEAQLASLREQVVAHKGMLRGVAARPAFEAICARVGPADGVEFHDGVVGGVAGIWCTPATVSSPVTLMHLHGGWFTWGTASGFRNLVGQLAARCGVNAFIPDYRLAPEHPYPAALDDARFCLRGLRDAGMANLVVTDDSAGGNLALLLAADRDARLAGVVAISPVTDLALTGPSWETRAGEDPYFTRAQAETLVEGYRGSHDPRDPCVSPLYAALGDLPPTLIQVGTAEVLLDDSTRFAERAADAGADVQLHIWEGMPHGILSGGGRFDAADAAFAVVEHFLAAQVAPRAGVADENTG